MKVSASHPDTKGSLLQAEGRLQPHAALPLSSGQLGNMTLA
jgi:hypothetical protein